MRENRSPQFFIHVHFLDSRSDWTTTVIAVCVGYFAGFVLIVPVPGHCLPFSFVMQHLCCLSCIIRKPAFACAKTKVQISCAIIAQLIRTADQHLYFCYIDSTIPLLPISESSSLQPSSVAVQPGLCRTWFETHKTGFLVTRLIISLSGLIF